MISRGVRKRKPGSVVPILVTFMNGVWMDELLNFCSGHSSLPADFATLKQLANKMKACENRPMAVRLIVIKRGRLRAMPLLV